MGEVLQAIYRVENHDRLTKPWVELWNESTLRQPARPRGRHPGARHAQWLAKVTLTRRGSYRLGALRVRTGDPFGLFSSEMVVGQATSVVVFPRSSAAALAAAALTDRRHDAGSPPLRGGDPLVSGVRPYVHGDAINRIHWLSSARHGELHVKEFDLEQAADLWITLDLDRGVHAGVGNDASVETAVTVAASVAMRTSPTTARWR